jgi:hypothetical protein
MPEKFYIFFKSLPSIPLKKDKASVPGVFDSEEDENY